MGVSPGLGVHETRVRSCEPCARDTMRLVIESGELAASILPGQFMQIAVPGDGSHILRVPLSFSRANDDGSIELIFAVVGEGTERLARVEAGTMLSVVGPCGRGWELPDADGRCLLVAGGVGLPPIVAACEMLYAAGRGCDVVIGARTAELLVRDEVEALRSIAGVEIATDDGSEGHAGFVTDVMQSLIDEGPYAQAYSCGPTPMMAGVAKIAGEAGIACQVSLERLMGCGFGVCNCCNVELAAGGYASCCTDGPVFDAREVAW